MTSSRPMAPAIRPACNEVRPSVADTVCALEVSKDSGSEPNFSCWASYCADCWVKLPLIWVLPPGIASWMFSAETTWVSSTTATEVLTCAAV